MAHTAQKPVQDQPKDGTRLADGSYVKNADHYDPAVVARIKDIAASATGPAMSGEEAIEHFRKLGIKI